MSTNVNQNSLSSKANIDNSIYKDFCDGMKNQSREHIRLTGEIARRITKATSSSKSADTLASTIANFCQAETHLENIENNLNKVCALTRNQK